MPTAKKFIVEKLTKSLVKLEKLWRNGTVWFDAVRFENDMVRYGDRSKLLNFLPLP
ncbi:hypothetical protein KAU34_01905 [candidate division WOR-3 bacterium]|nr:hypothetical protein [candidate division WOR-3 bacterium]